MVISNSFGEEQNVRKNSGKLNFDQYLAMMAGSIQSIRNLFFYLEITGMTRLGIF